MRFDNDTIIDFNNGYVLDAAVLSCFIDEEDIILFPYLMRNPHNTFVEDRKVFTNHFSIYQFPYSNGDLSIWYKAKGYYDLVQVLRREGITYTCMVIPKGATNVEEYKYLLHVYEHGMFDGEELRALYIIDEKVKGSYENKVLPKVKSLRIDELFLPEEEDEW